MKNLTMTAAIMLAGICANAQMKVGANPTVINASSALDVEATNKGFLMPRVALLSSTDVTTIANPAKGLQVFNIQTSGDVDSNYVYWFDGNKWLRPLTSQQSSLAPELSVSWNADSPTDILMLQNQVYVIGPYTVPKAGYYSFRSRIYFFTTSVTNPSPTIFLSIANDPTLNPNQGSLYDARFVISQGPVNATAPSLLYLNENTNYYIKYVADQNQCYFTAERQMLLILAK